MTAANPFAAAAAPAPAAQPAPTAPAFQPQAAPTQAAPAAPAFAPQPQNDTFSAPVSTQPVVQGATAPAGDPFAAPAGSTEAKVSDYVGELVLIKPTEYTHEYKTTQGIAPMVAGDLAVLSNVSGQFVPGTIEKNMFFFQKLLVRDLKSNLEGPSPMLLARLVMGQAKNGNSAPYLFQEATEEDKAIARQFLAAVQF